MIDWVGVGLNSLWILGLAMILAAFSYHYWLAGETCRTLRDVLAQRSWRLPFSAGMILMSVGVGYGLGVRWWEKTIWTALALSYGAQLVQLVRRKRSGADS